MFVELNQIEVFPHGDIQFAEITEEDSMVRSIWREVSLAFHLIKQAINPVLNGIGVETCL